MDTDANAFCCCESSRHAQTFEYSSSVVVHDADIKRVTAYDRLPNGHQLLSFDTTVSLPGGVIARRGDVVRFDGAAYTIELAAGANGIPSGAVTDAVSEIGPDDLLLSFDVAVEIGGVFADDEDLLRIHAGTISLFFDGSAAGIDPALDLDAAHLIATNGHLLLSFDGSGTVGGVSFAQSDVLEYTPSTGAWAASYGARPSTPAGRPRAARSERRRRQPAAAGAAGVQCHRRRRFHGFRTVRRLRARVRKGNAECRARR